MGGAMVTAASVARRMAPALPRFAAAAVLGLVMASAQAAAPAGTPPASQANAGTPAAAATPAAQGEQVYARWCVHCHAAGRGNPGTESLQAKYRGSVPAVLLERTDLTREAIAQFVRQGILSMPPFRKTEITDAELDALATYMTQRRTAAR